MIYFDNAATTMPKPPSVATAVADAISNLGNPSRGAHDASLNALRLLTRTRENIATLFGVDDPARVAFTLNATHALNIAIGGIRGHIVSTNAEHNSVLRPLYRRGNFTLVPLDDNGRLSAENVEQALRPDTEAVVMTHASNLTGNVFDVTVFGEICRRKKLRFIVDAAQTAGLLAIDMKSMGIDALCFSGHKSLYGPQGVGGICLASGFSPEPLVVGGSGSESFSTRHPTAMPDALEAGTQNAHGIAGLDAGLAYIREIGGRCFTDADRLARHFVEKVRELGGYEMYGDMDAPVRVPIVALNHRDMDSSELAYRLYEDYSIAVRAGVHCAPLMLETFGLRGVVRFSFSHLNTDAEIDRAVAALTAMR